MNLDWCWTIITIMSSFILSWLFFGTIWWIICFTHKTEDEGIYNPNFLHIFFILKFRKFLESSSWTSCIPNIYSYSSAILFSIETQTLIGYGVRATTEECPEAIILVCVQSIVGLFMQVRLSIVFKMTL